MTVRELLDSIPVYPESVRISATYKLWLNSKFGLCEDEKGRISWIDEEAKKSALGKMIPQKKPKPKQETNILYTAFGKSQTLRDWADEYGMNHRTLYSRIHVYGMDFETALTKKLDKRRWKK